MSTDTEINQVVDKLAETSVGDKIIDFSGYSLKLNNAEDGE